MNPFFNQPHVFFAQGLPTAWRHVDVRFGAKEFEQVAFLRLPRYQRRPALAAAQDRLERGQVQAALGFGRIVTLRAMLFEKRFDVRYPERITGRHPPRGEEQCNSNTQRACGHGFYALNVPVQSSDPTFRRGPKFTLSAAVCGPNRIDHPCLISQVHCMNRPACPFFLRPGTVPGLLLIASLMVNSFSHAAEPKGEQAWRPLPLIAQGKVDPNWIHLGWGGFVVDDGALRTECDPKGLGLLVYKKERLGNCQVRVIFKAKDPKSNAGVYVRIADGILEQAKNPGAAFERDAAGKPSDESMEAMKSSAEKEEGPWFAVHRGYEVQIAGDADAWHRTGAIYSLAPSRGAASKTSDWQTMVITLAADRIFVDLNGERVTSFYPKSPELPPRKQWHEPKREPKRPELGYIGLQNHDPGDVVWFKEVSVRPLPPAVIE